MKKLLTIFILTIISLLSFKGVADSATPIATPTDSSLSEQINSLKSRIASKVAQLKLVEKRGIIGKVSDVSANQITITNTHGDTVFIDVDELTKFSSPGSKGSFGISDITKDSTLGILGLYNKESRRILARFVTSLDLPRFIHASVAATDANNFTIDVVDNDKNQISIDVGTTTKTFSYTKSTGLIRSGFSKIKTDGNLIIIGFADKKDKNKILADKIIILSEIAKNSKTGSTSNDIAPQDTIVPSTGSGKKLTPIVK